MASSARLLIAVVAAVAFLGTGKRQRAIYKPTFENANVIGLPSQDFDDP